MVLFFHFMEVLVLSIFTSLFTATKWWQKNTAMPSQLWRFWKNWYGKERSEHEAGICFGGDQQELKVERKSKSLGGQWNQKGKDKGVLRYRKITDPGE